MAAMNGCRFANSVARDGPDPVDRREPEQVREHERPEDGEREQTQIEGAERVVVLVRRAARASATSGRISRARRR